MSSLPMGERSMGGHAFFITTAQSHPLLEHMMDSSCVVINGIGVCVCVFVVLCVLEVDVCSFGSFGVDRTFFLCMSST